MNQLDKIVKCIGAAYCHKKQKDCVGKDTTADELKLKKLYIAYWVSCGFDCDIECFISSNCKC
jgi:hypothetical protein